MTPAKIISSVRNGSMRLDVREFADGRFGFDFKPPGEYRKKVRVTTADAARQKAEEYIGLARGGKVERAAIDEKEYAEFLQWKAAKKAPSNISDLVPSFLASKRRKGVSPHTIRSLESTLIPLAKEFPGSIASLTRAAVEEWIDERPRGPRRWNNMHAAIVALHRFARRDGLLPAELCPVERMEKQKVKNSVLTYSPIELQKLLAAVPKEWLPLVALGAFAGLRPEEIAPELRYKNAKPSIRWENILWDKEKIDVPADVSKDRRRRFAPLLPVLRDWLADWRDARGPVVPEVHPQKMRNALCARAGVAWKSDGLRHSFASYRLAFFPDEAKLSLEMGNSIEMIRRHYLDLKHDNEAKEWFSSTPETCQKFQNAPSESARTRRYMHKN